MLASLSSSFESIYCAARSSRGYEPVDLAAEMPFYEPSPSEKDKRERWFMNFRYMIRMHRIALAGLGAAMLFAGSAYAQQEMDPTPFADGPYVEPMAQPVPGPSAETSSPAVMTPADVQRATFSAASESPVEGASVWTPLDELSLAGLFVCAACILLYEIAKAKRNGVAVRGTRATYLPRGLSTL
jgi:hypothetical protein